MFDYFENIDPKDLSNYFSFAEEYLDNEEFEKALYFATTYYVNSCDIDFDELSKIEKKWCILDRDDDEFLEVDKKYDQIRREIDSHKNSYILENAYDVTQDICKLINIKPSKNYFDCGIQNYKLKFYQFAINCLKKAIDLDPKKKYIDYLYKVIEEKKNNGR